MGNEIKLNFKTFFDSYVTSNFRSKTFPKTISCT